MKFYVILAHYYFFKIIYYQNYYLNHIYKMLYIF